MINALLKSFNWWFSTVSPGHAAEEVVLRCEVLRVLDGVFPFRCSFGSSLLPVSPRTWHTVKKVDISSSWNNKWWDIAEAWTCGAFWSNRGASGCESGPEARVCLPRWIEEPAARAESTPSLAGSEERKTASEELLSDEKSQSKHIETPQKASRWSYVTLRSRL